MDHTGAYIMAIALLAALLPPAPHRRGPVGRRGVHRGGDRHERPGRARLHRQRPAAARRRAPALQPQHVAGDGAARHLPVPRRRLVGGHRLPRRRRLGRARRRARRGVGRRTRRYATLAGRLAAQDDLDAELAAWTSTHGARRRRGGAARRRRCRPPRCSGRRSACDDDADNDAWGLWPTVDHAKHGAVRVDGLPVHLSATDWRIERAGPVLGQDNEQVYGEVLGLTPAEIGRLAEDGVI